MTEDRLAELMVKRADGLATTEEEEELMRHLREHPELRDELAAHEAVGAVAGAWSQRLVADAAEDDWAASAITRGERRLGWALMVAGVALFFTVGLWELMLDPEAPWWVKLGTGLLFSGLAVLSFSVVRWKWNRGRDPYDEVTR